MSTAAVSSSSLLHGQPYFQDRKGDLQQLGQALQSGDLALAQQSFSAIQILAQNGPFDGNAFLVNQRQQDFSAIGQALQAGDLAGAQQAFAQLQSTFSSKQPVLDPGPAAIVSLSQQAASAAASSSTGSTGSTAGGSAAGPIILNLGDGSGSGGPEQVNISFTNTGNGSEQITINSGTGSTSSTLSTTSSSAAVPEIILNFGNSSGSGGPEQIAISLTNTNDGAQQLTISGSTGSTGSTGATGSATGTSAAGLEIVLNLGNSSTSGSAEQININLTNTGNGAEQVTVGVGTQQNPNAQQINLNLAQNSNEQIVLNLLNNPSATPSQTSGVNVVA